MKVGRPGGFFFLVILLIIFSQVRVEAVADFSGTIDSYHSFFTTGGNGIIVSKNVFKGELSLPVGRGFFNLSVRGTQRGFARNPFESEILEAYFEYSFGKFEVRAGRQIIPWGKMERIRISDIINPLDLREYIAYDYEELRMGVDALQLSYFTNRMKLDLIWIPIFRSSRFPSPGSTWDFGYLFSPETTGENIGVELPLRSLRNSEWFAKASFFFKWVDVALFGFSSFNDIPEISEVTERSGTIDEYFYKGEFHKLTGGGIEFTKPVDFIILRGEIAFVSGTRFKNIINVDGSSEKDLIKFALGLDLILRGDFRFSVQVARETMIGDMDSIIPGQLNNLVTFKVSKKFFRNKLDLSNFFLIMVSGKDSYNRIKLDISLSDELHLITGADIFNGDGDLFGKYKKNSQFWIKLRYMF